MSTLPQVPKAVFLHVNSFHYLPSVIFTLLCYFLCLGEGSFDTKSSIELFAKLIEVE